jgi:hypothetical protein
MTTSSPSVRSVTTVLLLIALAISLPLIVLSFYNHPSPTDDYCFANTSMRYGFWESQQIYYDGWSGRFFHNFLVHGSPLTFGWYDGYKIYPVVLLGLLALSFYTFASQWLYRSFTFSTKLALACGLFIGFVATLVSLSEYLYWYAGMACYSLSSVFLLFLLAVLIAHERRGFGWKSGYLLLESLLIICIIGSSETSMVMIMSVLGMIALGDLVLRRRLSIPTLILLAVGVFSCYYLISAPGNAVRMGSNPNSRDIPLTLLSSLKFAVGYVARQIFLTPLLPLSLLYFPIASQLTANRPLPAYLRIHPLLALLHGLLTVLALISLHFYAVGIAPAYRLVNLINLVFWLSWGYNLTIWAAILQDRLQPVTWQRFSRLIVVVSLGWIVLATGFGPVLPMAYGDWLSGRAARYDQAMQERYNQMTQSTDDTALVTPLPVYPASMFMEDVKEDPKHLWNRCWADYYHKKTIVLKEEPISSTH